MRTNGLDAAKSMSPLDSILIAPPAAREAPEGTDFVEFLKSAPAHASEQPQPMPQAREAPPAARPEPPRVVANDTASEAGNEALDARSDGEAESALAPPMETERSSEEEHADEEEAEAELDTAAAELALSTTAADTKQPAPTLAEDKSAELVSESRELTPAPGAASKATSDEQGQGTGRHLERSEQALAEQSVPEPARTLEPPAGVDEAEVVAPAVLAPTPEAKNDAGGREQSDGRTKTTRKNTEKSNATEEAASHQVADVAAVADDAAKQEFAASDVADKPREGRKERARGEKSNAAREAAEVAASPGKPETSVAVEAAAKVAAIDAALTPASSSGAPEINAAVPTPVSNSPANVVAQNGNQPLRLPSQLAARGGERGGSGAPVTTAEQARFVQRVAKAFEAAQARGGEVVLRLNPPQLGSVKLEVKVQGGVLIARVEAETQTAQGALIDNLPILKERLAEQGIQIEKFDVDLMDRQPPGQHGQQPSEHRSTARQGGFAARSQGRDVAERLESPPTSPRPHAGDGRINITV